MMAYKVLLVDDEELTRRYLRKIVDWETEGYYVGAQAANGKEALALLEEGEWDLLITDIRMPIMDGLSLIEEVRKRNYPLKILVLSAFSDFEYARRSFTFGISDYLLKPVDEEELLQILRKINQQLSGKRSPERTPQTPRMESRETVIKNIIFGHKTDEDGETSIILNKFQLLSVISLTNQIIPDEVLGDSWHTSETSGFSYFPVTQGVWYILDEKPVGTQAISQFLKTLESACGFPLLVSVSVNHQGVDSLPAARREVELLGKFSYYGGQSRYKIYKKKYEKPSPPLDVESEKKGFLTALRNESPHEGFQYVEALADRLENHYGPRLDDLFLFCGTWLNLLRSTIASGDEGLLMPSELRNIYLDKLKSMDSMQELLIFLKQLVVEMKELPAHALSPESNDLIKQSKEFIAANLHRSFSLEELADEVGRSKNYLCRVFKDTTGERIWEYITYLRMERAKHLLKTSRFQVSEISKRVGYETPGYFTRVFKNRHGMTPQTFRENQL